MLFSTVHLSFWVIAGELLLGMWDLESAVQKSVEGSRPILVFVVNVPLVELSINLLGAW